MNLLYYRQEITIAELPWAPCVNGAGVNPAILIAIAYASALGTRSQGGKGGTARSLDNDKNCD